MLLLLNNLEIAFLPVCQIEYFSSKYYMKAKYYMLWICANVYHYITAVVYITVYIFKHVPNK
jgi:hypothetical protein